MKKDDDEQADSFNDDDDDSSIFEDHDEILKARILHVFKVFDQNKDNTIDINDVGNVYRCLLMNISQEKLNEIESQLLKTNDSVHLEHLMPRILSDIQNMETKFQIISDEALESAFRTLIEFNKNEALNKDKLEFMMTNHGESLTENEMLEMKTHLSIRKNGIIDWKSYIRDIRLSIEQMKIHNSQIQ